MWQSGKFWHQYGDGSRDYSDHHPTKKYLDYQRSWKTWWLSTCSRTESVSGATTPARFMASPSLDSPALSSNLDLWRTTGKEALWESKLQLEILAGGDEERTGLRS